MGKRYIVALSSVPVDISIKKEALVTPFGSPPPPPLSQVVLPRLAQHILENHGEFELIYGSSEKDFDKQKDLIKQAEIIIVVDPCPSLFSYVFPLASNVRWVHSIIAGVEGICAELRKAPSLSDLESRNNSSLLVTNARGVYSSSLKEYTVAAIMHFAKQIPRLQQNKKDKRWEQFIMGEIKGQTAGFIGYGDIAKEIASACKFFGLRCVAVRRDASKTCELLDAVYSSGGKDELEVYRQSDFVICSLPATPETVKCVSVDQFSSMKKTGVFISIGRGCVVDEDALLNALKSNQIAGAALDVFNTEPLPPSSPLWEAPNLLISCHNSDFCVNYSAEDSIKLFEKNFKKYLMGAKTNAEMVTPVDIYKGY